MNITPGTYEILEHTADIGIHARGDSLAEALEQGGLALAEILGVRLAGPGGVRAVRARGDDPGALVVDLLNELVLLHETEEVGFAAVRVVRATDTEVEAEVEVVALEDEPEGTAVKAATYHQLQVKREPDGAVDVRVYLDV